MKFGFSNYKSFVGYHEIELTPLTCLFGKNGSGKSSVLKIIDIISQIGLLTYPQIMNNIDPQAINLTSFNEDFPVSQTNESFMMFRIYRELNSLYFPIAENYYYDIYIQKIQDNLKSYENLFSIKIQHFLKYE